MKTRRIELRASPEFVKQLDDLAASMRCSTSAVIRRLVIAEHKQRFTAAIPTATTAAPHAITAPDVEVVATPSTKASPSVATAPKALIPLEQADAASRMFVELGFPPEDFGISV